MGTNTLSECLRRHCNTVQKLKSFLLRSIQIPANQIEKSQLCIFVRVIDGRQDKDFNNATRINF